MDIDATLEAIKTQCERITTESEGDPSPTGEMYQAGQRDTAEAILALIRSLQALPWPSTATCPKTP